MVLFLGSNTDLATSEWSKEEPGCFVGDLESYEEPVRQHFTKKHVRDLGSQLGCGCGFGFGYETTIGEEPENPASRRWLVDILDSLAKAEGEVDIYSCWSGDEALDIEERKQLRPTISTTWRLSVRARSPSYPTTPYTRACRPTERVSFLGSS